MRKEKGRALKVELIDASKLVEWSSVLVLVLEREGNGRSDPKGRGLQGELLLWLR